MKKAISSIIASLLVVTALAGCTSTPATSPAATPKPSAASTAAASPAATPKPSAAASPQASPAASSAASDDFEKKGYKIAYVLNGTSTEIFKMAFEAAKREAEKLGMTVTIFTTDNDDLKFQDYVNQCANQGYNAMIISHGKPAYSYDLIKPIVAKGIKVVTFDTVIEGPNKETIDGVTQMFQNDQEMAQLTLDYICNVMFKDLGRPVNVLKLWRGPGVPPFDRREETYKKFEAANKIKTLEVIGPPNPADSEGSIASAISSVLPKYPKGKVDVVWGVYDAYSRGAWKALTEANRTDVPIVSIDISNQDINIMRGADKLWKACAAVHFETVGEQAVRLLAMKLHGDQTPKEYILPPSLVTAEQLTPDANVSNLGQIVKGYGTNNDHITDWMKAIYDKTKK